jgi:uncharacterized membrane protein YsdA (DUF1294 family)
MNKQSSWSCVGALFAALLVLVLLSAEVAAFAGIVARYIEVGRITEKGWQALAALNTMWPYASLVLLLLLGWVAWSILTSIFNLFASLAEPEDGIPSFLGMFAVVVGLAFLGAVAAGYFLPQYWQPHVEKWADDIDAEDTSIFGYLKVGAPHLLTYLLVVSAASLHCFRLMGDDRHRMKNNDTRVSQTTLHWWEWLGGWPGSLAGLMVFHHRASSVVYLIGFVLAVAAHVATVAGILWLLKPQTLPVVG